MFCFKIIYYTRLHDTCMSNVQTIEILICISRAPSRVQFQAWLSCSFYESSLRQIWQSELQVIPPKADFGVSTVFNCSIFTSVSGTITFKQIHKKEEFCLMIHQTVHLLTHYYTSLIYRKFVADCLWSITTNCELFLWICHLQILIFVVVVVVIVVIYA